MKIKSLPEKLIMAFKFMDENLIYEQVPFRLAYISPERSFLKYSVFSERLEFRHSQSRIYFLEKHQ